jgi:hypothetical protein
LKLTTSAPKRKSLRTLIYVLQFLTCKHKRLVQPLILLLEGALHLAEFNVWILAKQLMVDEKMEIERSGETEMGVMPKVHLR